MVCLVSAIANASDGFNILYRTTDSRYRPTFAVTTLLVPSRPFGPLCQPSNYHAPLRSYQIDYDTPDLDDSPSFALPTLTLAISDISTALGRGCYVNVPDYEGHLASFTAGVIAGHATLDSIRAVLNIGLTPESDIAIAMWGYSGGSIATEWAGELHAQYAPELQLRGAALGGLVPSIQNTVEKVSGGPLAGLFPLGAVGLSRQYPELLSLYEHKLNLTGQFNRTAFLSVANMSLTEAVGTFFNQDVFSYFLDGRAILETPLLQQTFNLDGLMGFHGVPTVPLFVYKAIGDEVSPIEDTDALVTKYCALGANITYQRNSVGGHEAEQVNGDESAVQFLISVLEGSSSISNPGCTVQNVTIDITSSLF